MAEAKICSTSCAMGALSDTNVTLCSVEDASPYRSRVGALHYLTFTRPDIAYAVSRVSQFMHSPNIAHLTVVKRIFRYLRGSLDLGLYFRVGSLWCVTELSYR